MIVVTFDNVAISLGDGANPVVLITNAKGALLFDLTGLTGQGSASVALAASTGVSLSGIFEFAINTKTTPVHKQVNLADGSALLVDLPAGPFVRVQGQNVTLQAAGETLKGDFVITQLQAGELITVAFDNVGVTLSAGTTPFFVVTGGTARSF